MNVKDRNRLTTIRATADRLLNAPMVVNPRVTNMDVMEAVLEDVRAVAAGQEPKELDALVVRAQEAGEL